jgi:hypothetical protein
MLSASVLPMSRGKLLKLEYFHVKIDVLCCGPVAVAKSIK